MKEMVLPTVSKATQQRAAEKSANYCDLSPA